MKILILEDNSIRVEYFKQLFKHQYLHIYDDVHSAIVNCQVNEFPVMFLDHDLDNKIWVNSEEENTGYNFIRLLIENNLQKGALIYIHSMNPIGANKMLNLLKDNNRDGIWIPFHLIGK